LIRNKESEFLDTAKSKDPYEYINKKTHKIEINPGMPYRSTSMDEVFEIRNELNDAIAITGMKTNTLRQKCLVNEKKKKI